MPEVKRNTCKGRLSALRLAGLLLLMTWGSLAFAAQPKEVVYTAKDLKLEKYFSGANASYRLKSKDKYDALFILGEFNGKRSGQDAFYWPPALSILMGCSMRKLGARLGHQRTVVLATDRGRVDAQNPDAGDRAEIQFVAPAYVLTPEDISHSRVLLDFEGPETEVLDRLCLTGME